jgi:hypothetical protein
MRTAVEKYGVVLSPSKIGGRKKCQNKKRRSLFNSKAEPKLVPESSHFAVEWKPEFPDKNIQYQIGSSLIILNLVQNLPKFWKKPSEGVK